MIRFEPLALLFYFIRCKRSANPQRFQKRQSQLHSLRLPLAGRYFGLRYSTSGKPASSVISVEKQLQWKTPLQQKCFPIYGPTTRLSTRNMKSFEHKVCIEMLFYTEHLSISRKIRGQIYKVSANGIFRNEDVNICMVFLIPNLTVTVITSVYVKGIW